jgi:glycosyltransferase involved in cell wall biosynthesis
VRIETPAGLIGRERLAPTERIRLLKFVTYFGVGGTERQVTIIAKGLDAAQFDLHLACLHRSGELLQQIERLPRSAVEYSLNNLYDGQSLRERLRFARHLRQLGIQIVHTYNFYPNVFALPAARLARVPVTVASIRDMGVYLTPMQLRVQRVACRLADRIVANAEAVRQWLIGQGYRGDRITVIRNGVDLARFDGRRGGSSLRQELGLPATSPLVAVVARVSPTKGLEYFLDAAASLAARHPDAYFLVVGQAAPDDQEYERGLQAYAARLGLERRVVFTGLRLDIPEVLSEMAVSVLPSLSEGLSNVLLESMAAGVPVVATRVGGNGEAVEDGVTGLLVEPRDAVGLAGAIGRILDDRELAGRFGAAGRQRVAERFSIEASVRATERLYLELLERRGHAR